LLTATSLSPGLSTSAVGNGGTLSPTRSQDADYMH
jgi:hypothetical protein